MNVVIRTGLLKEKLSRRITSAGHRDPSLTGIFLIIMGGFIFSIQDVIIKSVSNAYPVHEIVFFRSLFALGLIIALIRISRGFAGLKIRSRSYHLFRCLLMFFTYTTYYLAIGAIPLSLAVSLFFCCPLFITALSAVFLKEKISLRGWAALLTGFTGIIVIMKPDPAALSLIDPGSLLAVLSGLFYAVNAVCTRKFGVHETGVSLVFYPMAAYLILSGILFILMGDGRYLTADGSGPGFLLRAWIVPSGKDLFFFLVIGVVSACGTFCLSQAYRISAASVVAPFEYFAIPISIAWGYLFWQEALDLVQTAGIFMVAASGIYVLKRPSSS